MLFLAHHGKTPNQEDTEDQSTSPPLAVSYFLEVFPQEEDVHGCQEDELMAVVTRLLLEDSTNKEIEDWIQVNHEKMVFKRNVPVECV